MADLRLSMGVGIMGKSFELAVVFFMMGQAIYHPDGRDGHERQ